MSSQMQAFGSWRIILLNSDDLGDDGDVLTRVGANGTAFRPGGGGGAASWGGITGTLSDQTDLQSALDAKSPAFDQDLNTDDDVVFASVEINGPLEIPTNAIISTTGQIRTGSAFALNGRNTANDADRRIIEWDGDGVSVGTGNNGFVDLNGTSINLSTNSGSISLFIDSDLNINGTPGVTNAAIVVDGVTLSFTKGILTGVA